MSESIKLSVDNGSRKIEVNDQGEYIILPLGDQAFLSGFLALMKEISTEAGKIAGSLKAANDNRDSKMEQISAAVTLNLEICKEMKARVDELFHDEVCRKVFGNIVPSLMSLVEFFDKLNPFVQEYADIRAAESEARISKYTEKYRKKDEK